MVRGCGRKVMEVGKMRAGEKGKGAGQRGKGGGGER